MHLKYLVQSFFVLFILFSTDSIRAQSDSTRTERPSQLDVFKLNVLQLGVNEARLSYEMEIRPFQSLEFGLGFIYPNSLWFNQGDTPVLATGGGVYFSYRKYRAPKRFFSRPLFTTYFSPFIFYRYSAYQDEWLLFQGPSPETSECAQFSETIHQLGLVFRLGGQTSVGRIVLDIYGGLGIKYIPSTLTQHALNRETDVCEILPTTDLTETVTEISDFQAVLHAGLKIGLRRNNRTRNYEDRGITPAPQPVDDAPPIYQP